MPDTHEFQDGPGVGKSAEHEPARPAGPGPDSALPAESGHPLEAVRGAATAFSDILSVSAARGASIILALVSVTIVTHLLDPAQYATLAYVGVVSGLIFTGTSSWTATAVARYGREELERDGCVRATSWGRLALTAPLVVVAIVVVCLGKAFGAAPTQLTWNFVFIACATGIALIAAEHFVNLLEACGRMKLTALVLMLGRVLSIAGLVILAAVGLGRSAAAVALVWLGAGLVFAAFLAAFLWKPGIWPPKLDRELFRRMVALSVPLIAFAISQYVIGAVDVVILGAYRPARDVGLYAIAYQGYGVLQQIATTATIVLSPLFVSLRIASREHVIERYYERTIPQVILLSSVGAGLVAPFVRLAVPAIFGASFAPTYEPLTILLVAWIMFATASFAAPILVLHERARSLGAINVLAAVINVGGDWLLISRFGVGIAGPALATAASLAVVAVGYLWVAADCIDHRRTLPLAMIAPALAGTTIALGLPNAVGAGASVAGTLLTATTVFLLRHPFVAQDIDLIGRLDIPGPFKRLTLRALARLG